MDDLEAFAAGYSASLHVMAEAGAPIESATVRLNVFVAADAPSVLQWAAGAIAQMLTEGPERAGFSGTPTPTGALFQILARPAIPPDPEQQMTFRSIGDLKDAAVAAGLPCTVWTQDNAVELAVESGTCSDDSVLSIYASEADQITAISNQRRFAEMMVQHGLPAVPLLVGPNWLISAPEAPELAEALGGVVYTVV